MAEWNHYALRDPRIEDEILSVRYVGRTVKSIAERLARHLKNARAGHLDHRSNWIRQLLRDGVSPVGISLGVGGSDCESQWIALYRGLGAVLTNATDGGDGVLNPTPAARANMSAAQKVNQSLPEVKEKKSAAIKAAWTDEARKRHSARMKEAYSGAEIRNKIAGISKASHANPKTRAAQAAAARAAHSLPEVKAKVAATFARPEVRAKRSEIARETNARADVKEKIAASSRLNHADPAFKARHSAAIKEAWSRPDVRQRQAAGLKEMWDLRKETQK